MRALRDSNTAKIIQEDEPIFFGLLGDLFPGLDPPRKIDPNLKAALVETCEKLQLWPDTDYIDRCMQLAELLSIRHCVFLLGPPGCGRTSLLYMLVVLVVSLPRLYCTCWWYSLCNFQYRHYYDKTGLYNLGC